MTGISVVDTHIYRLDEIDDLHLALDRLEDEKHALEDELTEQADTVRKLNESNAQYKITAANHRARSGSSGSNTSSSEHLKKLEQQTTELNQKLGDAMEELDRTRAAESMQRVALLDELNSLQQENGSLRNQLRQRK